MAHFAMLLLTLVHGYAITSILLCGRDVIISPGPNVEVRA